MAPFATAKTMLPGSCRLPGLAAPRLTPRGARRGSDVPLNDTVTSAGCGYDIRTVQEWPGHKDLKTTMVYTHVLNRGGHGVKSPADTL